MITLMITLPTTFMVLAVIALMSLIGVGIFHHRSRMRYNDKLETAFNRARYTRECGGR